MIPMIFCQKLEDSDSRSRKHQCLELLIKHLCLINLEHFGNLISLSGTSKLGKLIHVLKVRNICPILIKTYKLECNIICPRNNWITLPAIVCIWRHILNKTIKVLLFTMFLLVSDGHSHHLFDKSS